MAILNIAETKTRQGGQIFTAEISPPRLYGEIDQIIGIQMKELVKRMAMQPMNEPACRTPEDERRVWITLARRIADALAGEAMCVCGYPMSDHEGHGGNRVCERICEGGKQ